MALKAICQLICQANQQINTQSAVHLLLSALSASEGECLICCRFRGVEYTGLVWPVVVIKPQRTDEEGRHNDYCMLLAEAVVKCRCSHDYCCH